MAEAGFFPLFCESGRGRVAPAAFRHETVPDLDLLGIGLAAGGLEAPFENLLIRAALERAGGERVEIDPEEAAHAVIKGAAAGDESEVVTLGQLPFPGVQADFVEDAAEDDDAADGVARGADGEGHAT